MTDLRDEPEGTIWRPIRMSETLFRQLGASGVEWGDPDAEGFYTPTIHRDAHRCRDNLTGDDIAWLLRDLQPPRYETFTAADGEVSIHLREQVEALPRAIVKPHPDFGGEVWVNRQAVLDLIDAYEEQQGVDKDETMKERCPECGYHRGRHSENCTGGAK